MPDIINNVAKTLLWDIFVMGTFFIATVWLSVVFVIAFANRDRLGATLNCQVKHVRNLLATQTVPEAGVRALLALVFVYYIRPPCEQPLRPLDR